MDQPPGNQYFHSSVLTQSRFYFCASWTIQNCHSHGKQCYVQETEVLSSPWPLLPLMCRMIYMGKLPSTSFLAIQNLLLCINESTATASSPSHHLTPLQEMAQNRYTAFELIRTGAAAQTLQEPSQGLQEGSSMHSSQQSTQLCLHLLYINLYKLLSLANPL